MDLTYLDGLHHVKAVLYASQGGMEGGTALGEILSGDVPPSGKLTDSWGSSYEMWPGYDQFGRNNGDVQLSLIHICSAYDPAYDMAGSYGPLWF